jgi:hypothetical protein
MAKKAWYLESLSEGSVLNIVVRVARARDGPNWAEDVTGCSERY